MLRPVTVITWLLDSVFVDVIDAFIGNLGESANCGFSFQC